MAIGFVPNVFQDQYGPIPLRELDEDLAYISAKTVTVTDYFEQYGGDATGTDDCTAAINAAIADIASTGGAIVFPVPGRYLVMSRMDISSIYPIALLSNMQGYSQVSPYGSFIQIGADMTSVFRYLSPTAGRGDGGGGIVRGLAFRDITGGSSLPGTFDIDAALDLYDFNLSYVEDCSFHYLKGSAIKTGFCVQSQLTGLKIRYCGDTSKPALWLASDSGAVYVTQATTFQGNIEVCHLAPYLQEDRYSANNKFQFNFEADTAIAPSNQLFFSSSGTRPVIQGTHFDRNTGVQFDFDANCTFPVLSGCISNTNGPTAQVACNTVVMSGFVQFGAYTGVQLKFTNGGATITGYKQRGGGSIDLGIDSTMTGGEVGFSVTTSPYAILADDNTTVNGVEVYQSTIAGGIKLTGTGPAALNCSVHHNVGIGIRNESADSAVLGNRCYTNTGGDMSFTNYPVAYSVNSNFVFDGDYPLYGEATYNPPNLGAGAGANTTVAVIGAVQGDFAEVSFEMSDTGVLCQATSCGADVVNVSFFNTTAGAIDLDEGVLTASVRKKEGL